MEVWKKNWKSGNCEKNLGKCGNLENNLKLLEENVKVWGKFGNRKNFGKLGESLEMRGIIGKIWE